MSRTKGSKNLKPRKVRKFKVGDLVEILSNDWCVPKGKVGTIVGFRTNTTAAVEDQDELYPLPWYIHTKSLKLVKPAPKKAAKSKVKEAPVGIGYFEEVSKENGAITIVIQPVIEMFTGKKVMPNGEYEKKGNLYITNILLFALVFALGEFWILFIQHFLK